MNLFETQPWNAPGMLPREIREPGTCSLPPPIFVLNVRHKRVIQLALPSARRSTSDKTGQATRARIRRALLKRYGPYCWLCLAGGKTEAEAEIDLELRFPDPLCFTRDHVKPRSKGGSDAIANQRPAHKVCNESRGNRSAPTGG